MESAKASGDDDLVEFTIIAMQEKDIDPDMPQPEPLTILRMLRNANTSYWAGGLANQPYFLLMELNAAANGERKQMERKMASVRGMLK